jgi:putative transposase
MRMWRYRVIRLLKKAYIDGTLNLPNGLKSLCPDIKHFTAWLNRRLHKPWIVHVAKPTPNPMLTISYLGRYLRRPPISQSRLRHYDGKYVVFNFLNHKTNKHQNFYCSTEEFIRRFIQHIPKKNFRMVRYYGFLANRVRGEKLPMVRTLLGQEASPKTYNLKYAELMQKTLGINPKECILCESEMTLKYRQIGANAAFFYENHEALSLRKRLSA